MFIFHSYGGLVNEISLQHYGEIIGFENSVSIKNNITYIFLSGRKKRLEIENRGAKEFFYGFHHFNDILSSESEHNFKINKYLSLIIICIHYIKIIFILIILIYHLNILLT